MPGRGAVRDSGAAIGSAFQPRGSDPRKRALIRLETSSVTVQVLASPQPADQPMKVEPSLGASVSVTRWPSGTLREQTEPQSTPTAAALTVPAPVPVLTTVRVGSLTAPLIAAPRSRFPLVVQ